MEAYEKTVHEVANITVNAMVFDGTPKNVFVRMSRLVSSIILYPSKAKELAEALLEAVEYAMKVQAEYDTKLSDRRRVKEAKDILEASASGLLISANLDPILKLISERDLLRSQLDFLKQGEGVNE
jgi:hypothetical protein